MSISSLRPALGSGIPTMFAPATVSLDPTDQETITLACATLDNGLTLATSSGYFVYSLGYAVQLLYSERRNALGDDFTCLLRVTTLAN